MAFLEYLYTACVTTIVCHSAFMETSLCTLCRFTFIVVFVYIVASYLEMHLQHISGGIFVAFNFLIL